MPHGPAEVGGSPEHLTRLHVVHVLHRPEQRDRVSAVVAHHSLGLTGRARGIQNVQWIGGQHRYTRHRHGSGHGLCPVDIAASREIAAVYVALQHHAMHRLMRRHLERLIEQRLVGHDALPFNAAAGREHHFRLRVVDAHRQLVWREATEHHRVYRPDARARIHADQRLGRHRHVDDHAIALLHAK